MHYNSIDKVTRVWYGGSVSTKIKSANFFNRNESLLCDTPEGTPSHRRLCAGILHNGVSEFRFVDVQYQNRKDASIA